MEALKLRQASRVTVCDKPGAALTLFTLPPDFTPLLRCPPPSLLDFLPPSLSSLQPCAAAVMHRATHPTSLASSSSSHKPRRL